MTNALADRNDSVSSPAPSVLTDRNRFAVKLATQVRAGERRISPFRKRRTEFIRTFCGPYYGTSGDVADVQYLNTIWAFVTSLIPALDMSTIECLGDSTILGMKRASKLCGKAVTAELQAMRAAQTYREVLLDSFFGPGLTKIGIAKTGMREDFQDWRQDPNRVFWRRISLDDYILDPRCRRREEAVFEGDAFSIETRDAHELYPDAKGKLDRLESIRIASLSEYSRGLSHPFDDNDDLYPEYRLAEIWLARDGVVVTVPMDKGAENIGFIHEAEYDGPEGGPYDMLYYKLPPDNPFPISPVEQKIALHIVQNIVASKTAEQAKNAKNVWGYGLTQGDADANALAGSNDRSMVGLVDPNAVKEFIFPGPSKDMLATMEYFQNWSSQNGPNVDIIGGMKANQKTLGQTQLLAAQSSDRMSEMRSSATSFLEQVCRRIAWYVWNRNDREIPVTETIMGEPTEFTWGPDEVTGDFLDVNFKVSVYTMGQDSPAAQYERMLGLISGVLIPMMPAAIQSGTVPDVKTIFTDMAERLGFDDMERWFAPPMQMPVPQEQPSQTVQQGGDTTNVSVGGGQGRPVPTEPEQVEGEINGEIATAV